MRVLLPLLLVATAGCLNPVIDTFRAGEVEPPAWRVGDWWTYRLTSEVFGTDVETTVIVANLTPNGYVLGTPAGDDATDAILQHMPAIGPVRDDLSWDVHEERFTPLPFPLRDGAEWETKWIVPVHLNIRLNQTTRTWNVTNTGFADDDGTRYNLTYDPAVGAITFFERQGLDGRIRQRIELIANGTGHQGDVRTIGNVRVALLESRTAGTLAGGVPAAPNPRFSVPEGTDTLLAGCMAGGAPGQYHAEIRSPTGVICQVDANIPPGSNAMQKSVVEAPVEEGAWEARLFAGGPGTVIAEALGYTTQIVTLT